MRSNEQHNAKGESAKRDTRVITWVALVVCAVVLIAGSLLAKYVTSNQRSAETESSTFHISSDYLEESTGGTVDSYTLADWKDGFDILLYNYEKENVAQVSQEDITYTVDATDATVRVTDAGGNSVSPTAGTSSYTLPKGTGDTESTQLVTQVLHVMPSPTAEPGTPITVSVKATAPYSKTLSATFNLAHNSMPDYTIHDQGDGTVLVTVKTNEYDGNVTVEWDSSKFSPDNTNNLMSGWTDVSGADTSSTGTFEVDSKSTYELLFFKNTNAAFNGSKEKSGTGTTIELN